MLISDESGLTLVRTQRQTSQLMVVYCVLILGWKMAEMGQKTDGGFGILAGFVEEKTPSWYQSKAWRKPMRRVLELSVKGEANS